MPALELQIVCDAWAQLPLAEITVFRNHLVNSLFLYYLVGPQAHW